MTKRRLVIVNQAANYLTVGLANAFVAQAIDVTLMTGSVHEQGEALDPRVRRVALVRWRQRPAWRKGLAYVISLVQAWTSLITSYRGHEVLFVSIPPMAYLLSLVLPNRCSVLVWDVYPDIFKVTGMSAQHVFYRLSAVLTRRAFARMRRILTITEPMRELLNNYTTPEKVTVTSIWSIFDGSERICPADNAFLQEASYRRERFIVQYSGNIGVTHNVEALLDVAALLQSDSRFLVQIIGRGPREQVIRSAVEARELDNVEMLPFQSDERFIHSLSAADVGVVVLNPRVSRGSVPSKAYNLMAFGIPALYIAASDSELSRYATELGTGRCFDADEPIRMAEYIRELADHPQHYAAIRQRAREASMWFSRSNAERFVRAYL